MARDQPILIYITAANEDEAARIGRTLVEERLCACANILGPVRSFYRWKGELCDEREAVLVAKTTAERVQAVVARVRELHSYEVPCVVAVPIADGNPAFLEWVAGETAR